MLACGILTYGGVSLFVVAFAIYPIAKDLFRSADIPKRLIPATIALGSFTFTMTALPGTPAIQNAIPIPYYGTNVFAAPGLGLIAGAIMFLGGCGGCAAELRTPMPSAKATARTKTTATPPRPTRARKEPCPSCRCHWRCCRSYW